MAFLAPASNQRIHLSLQELQAISQLISRDYTPYIVSRIGAKQRYAAFSSQELLSISLEINREFAPQSVTSSNNLVILPLEPRKLHVYWQLGSRLNLPNSVETKPELLKLRLYNAEPVSPLTQTTATLLQEPEACLEISLAADKTHQEISLPTNIASASRISASLGVYDSEQHFQSLLNSNIAELPQPCMPKANFVLPEVLAQFIIPNMIDSTTTGHTSTYPLKP
jgi:hypothetical protein